MVNTGGAAGWDAMDAYDRGVTVEATKGGVGFLSGDAFAVASPAGGFLGVTLPPEALAALGRDGAVVRELG